MAKTRLIKDAQSFISEVLHNLLFLEEFVFARNKFTPPASSELELADGVVMLGDVLLVFQIKERLIDRRSDAVAECKWFRDKVLGKATRQVRDTLGYLQNYTEILVPNERGHRFNLAANSYKDVIKTVVYVPSAHLPEECRNIRSYISRSAGFIHIININDYLEISRTLRVPQDVIQYFKFREAVLTQFADACASLPESALAGHFIVSDSSAPPTLDSAEHLRNLVQDSSEWDLAPILRSLHKHFAATKDSTEYYEILLEFIKLPRSAWRQVKSRLRLCLEKAQKDEFSPPYRMVVPDTGCGFVFIAIQSQFVQASDWQTIRVRAVRNFTMLHKYDQRLSKCIGYLIGRDGDYFDTDWCLLSYDWVEDPELQKMLDEKSPFRPVKEAVAYGYFITTDEEGASQGRGV